ncbi:hypothetical protein PsYK624_062140 [Phanerochaete sordida]|uniref:Uncharacterized protein n=1 Tax=Phanerochaete sordida TaxID=48140 RepID=A0A9P3G8C2_9APHY|nr:hypothetical protein PsYK624_062140 [Phanerochaete sordida]
MRQHVSAEACVRAAPKPQAHFQQQVPLPCPDPRDPRLAVLVRDSSTRAIANLVTASTCQTLLPQISRPARPARQLSDAHFAAAAGLGWPPGPRNHAVPAVVPPTIRIPREAARRTQYSGKGRPRSPGGAPCLCHVAVIGLTTFGCWYTFLNAALAFRPSASLDGMAGWPGANVTVIKVPFKTRAENKAGQNQ